MGNLARDRVPLHSKRAGGEHVGASLVVEGVEDELDLVLVPRQAVAIGEVGADRPWIRIEGPHADVQVALVVQDQALGAKRRRQVVAGVGLVLERQGQGRGPGRLVQDAVHADRRTGARHAQGRLGGRAGPRQARHHQDPQEPASQGVSRHPRRPAKERENSTRSGTGGATVCPATGTD